VGEYRWTYNKADLTAVFPGPLTIESDYPPSYRQLKSLLKGRYGFEIQDQEFSLTYGGEPLAGEDSVSTPLVDDYSQLLLYPTPCAPRFQMATAAGPSALGLIFIQPNKRVPLRALMDFNQSAILPLLLRKGHHGRYDQYLEWRS